MEPLAAQSGWMPTTKPGLRRKRLHPGYPNKIGWTSVFSLAHQSHGNLSISNEYNGVSAEVFALQYELEKAQLQIVHLGKELYNHQKIIKLLEEKISDK